MKMKRMGGCAWSYRTVNTHDQFLYRQTVNTNTQSAKGKAYSVKCTVHSAKPKNPRKRIQERIKGARKNPRKEPKTLPVCLPACLPACLSVCLSVCKLSYDKGKLSASSHTAQNQEISILYNFGMYSTCKCRGY